MVNWYNIQYEQLILQNKKHYDVAQKATKEHMNFFNFFFYKKMFFFLESMDIPKNYTLGENFIIPFSHKMNKHFFQNIFIGSCKL